MKSTYRSAHAQTYTWRQDYRACCKMQVNDVRAKRENGAKKLRQLF